jgi:hypothetical protein
MGYTQSKEQLFQISLSDDLAQEAKRVQADYQAYLATLPPDVRPLMIEMDMTDLHMSPGRLSVLALPFWVGEAYGIEQEIQRSMALGNIYGLLHFVTQDLLVDGEYEEGQIPALVLSGTLYQKQLLAIYQRFFPPQSEFWAYMNKYWLEWAESIAWERRVGLCPTFDRQDLFQASRKAAPLKICPIGLALLGHRDGQIPDLERAVDMMHIVMQMADDLTDMAEDLAGKRFNSALSLMVSRGTLDPHSDLTISQIGRSMLTSGDDQVYFQIMQNMADETQNLLQQMGLPQWSDLIQQSVQQARSWRNVVVADFLPAALDQFFKDEVAQTDKT